MWAGIATVAFFVMIAICAKLEEEGEASKTGIEKPPGLNCTPIVRHDLILDVQLTQDQAKRFLLCIGVAATLWISKKEDRELAPTTTKNFFAAATVEVYGVKFCNMLRKRINPLGMLFDAAFRVS